GRGRRTAAARTGASAPEFLARDRRPLGERLQFGPDDIRVHASRADMDAETAVHGGHDVLTSHEVGITPDPLGDQLGVLDVVGLALDHSRYQHLALGNLHLLEYRPLVGM